MSDSVRPATASPSDSLENPWMTPIPNTRWASCIIDASSRIATIKGSTDVKWLRRVLNWGPNQVAVHNAVERRLRVLAKQQKEAAV